MNTIIDSNKQVGTFIDWRLPTIQELLTLVDYTKSNPASKLKDTKSNYYWSSTTYFGYTSDAWVVYFGNGTQYLRDKSNSFYVRCVRTGKNGLEWSKSSEETMTWDGAIIYAKELEAPVYYKGRGINVKNV